MMTFSAILKAIKKSKNILISTHANPDADALCSCLAAALWLKTLKKKVCVVHLDRVPQWLRFLPHTDSIRMIHQSKDFDYDLALILDCGDLARTGNVERRLDKQKTIINIDHHVTNDRFGTINYVDLKASSTCEIIFDLLTRAGARLTRDIAMLLYSGIMTDSGSFRFENTTAKTHAVASRLLEHSFNVFELYNRLYEGVPVEDLKKFTALLNSAEILFNGKVATVALSKNIQKKFKGRFDLRDKLFTFLRTFKGIEVLVIFTEQKKNKTRVNFRSQSYVDVARVAALFGGGGHKRASGCALDYSLEKSQKKILTVLRKQL